MVPEWVVQLPVRVFRLGWMSPPSPSLFRCYNRNPCLASPSRAQPNPVLPNGVTPRQALPRPTGTWPDLTETCRCNLIIGHSSPILKAGSPLLITIEEWRPGVYPPGPCNPRRIRYSAVYDGTPRSFTATGLVDYEVPPTEMPSQLMAYVSHAFGRTTDRPCPRAQTRLPAECGRATPGLASSRPWSPAGCRSAVVS